MIKPVADLDREERCPHCEGPSTRQFVPHKVHLTKTAVQHAEYNPGLGQVVRNRQHKEEICKQKGLVEVGNDFGSAEKMVDSFDRAREEKLAKRYEDI